MNRTLTTYPKFVFFALLLLVQACQKETLPVVVKEYPNVAPELWTFFQDFENAATDRGQSIDLITAGITAEIGQTGGVQWAGQCHHNPDAPNHIILNADFWSMASKMRKEKIVFHELGHCILERGHVEEILPNGRCKSLMRSGTGSCIDNYTNDTKAYYLDELFVNE